MAIDVAGQQILAQPVSGFLQGRAIRQAEDHGERKMKALEAAEAREAETFEMQKQDRQVKYDEIAGKKALAGAQQVLALPKGQRKRFVEQNFSEVISGLEKQGYGTWDEIDEDELEELATGIQARAMSDLGMSPGKSEAFTLKKGEQRFVGDRMVAENTAPEEDEWTNPEPAVVDGREVMVRYHKRTGESQVVPGVSPRPQRPLAEVNVNTKQETEEAKAIGRELGKQYADIQKSGTDATFKISRFERMSQLLDGVKTGKLTPKMTEVAALADAFGIKLDPNIGEKQALQALSNEIALQLRNPSGGAGMPGAMSDKDREFLVSMTPGLSNTPEGNKFIIQTATKLAKREQQIAKMAREYRKREGSLEGFAEELAQWSIENPLFDTETALMESASPPVTATGPNGQKLILKNGQWVPINGQ